LTFLFPLPPLEHKDFSLLLTAAISRRQLSGEFAEIFSGLSFLGQTHQMVL
jgi:hypothetical protein